MNSKKKMLHIKRGIVFQNCLKVLHNRKNTRKYTKFKSLGRTVYLLDVPKHEKDLFEELVDKLGCMYISDLTVDPYNQAAKKLMAKTNCQQYSISTLNDMANYLYGDKHCFETMTQAQHFFCNYGMLKNPDGD